MHFTAFW